MYACVIVCTPVAAEAFERVAPGVYVRYGVHEDMSVENRGAIGNVVAIVGEEAVAVIDPGGSTAEGMAVREAIADITTLPIRTLVFTHVHPDHVLAASAFDAGIERVAHERFDAALLRRAGFYLERHAALLDGDDVLARLRASRQVSPDAVATIDLGQRVLELQAWPTGHTDHDLTVFDRATGTLVAGDLLFATRLPSLDGSLRGWQRVIDRLSARYADARRTIPGHGRTANLADIVAPQRRYLVRLAREVGAAIDAGVSLANAQAAVAKPRSPPWKLVDLHHPANVTRAYSELEWE